MEQVTATEYYKNGMYPTVFDAEDAAMAGSYGRVLVDEIKGVSHILEHAAVVPTNARFSHEYDREIEHIDTAKTAAMDEGWYASGGTRTVTLSCDTMRLSDSKEFDQLQERGSADKGVAVRAKNLKQMADSMLRRKVKGILYGGLPNAEKKIDAKEVPGLVTYLDKISNMQAMIQRYEEGRYSPFISENCLAIDNQEGASSQAASAVSGKKESNVWSSVYMIAWSNLGVFTTYPSHLASYAGYNMNYRVGDRIDYIDKYDGIQKHRYKDTADAELMFGVGVANRYCLAGLRNIYLGHSVKDDLMDEMYRVEQNLIKMASFYRKGETGIPVYFYANDELVRQMAAYQQNRLSRVTNTPTQNSGALGNMINAAIEVSPGISLISDFAVKQSESFISEKEE